jgi:hypothetical protein
MKIKAIVVLMFSFFALHAQTTLNINLSDLHKKPITYAIIKYAGNTYNSNNTGFFRISNYKLGSNITIHKLGYADTMVTFAQSPNQADSLNVNIVLRFKPIVLPEISISSAIREEVNPMRAAFVYGYELKGEHIIQLLSDGIIVVIDSDNKVSYRSRPITGIKDMVKDAYGNIYLVSSKRAYKIYPDSAFIRIDSVYIDLEKLNWNLQYFDDVNDTSLFIRRYKDYNQTVAFFAISSLHPKHVRQIKEIGDNQRKNAVHEFANESIGMNNYLASLKLSKVSASTPEELKLVRSAQLMADMLEMNYVSASYSILKLVNDSLYLFAHDIDTMFVYDQKWNLVKSKRLYYHHLKIWGKELLVNEEKSKVYAKLIENSKFIIAEIDLQTGLLKSAPTIIKARFPNKIKIRNDVVYFMAKSESGIGYTIYSQKLQLPP